MSLAAETSSAQNHLRELEVDFAALEPYWTVAWFFKCARNCIAHRNGVASEELERRRYSSDLCRSISRWEKSKNGKLPKLPSVKAHHVVSFHPTHAILASDAWYQIASAIDRNLIRLLDADGLIRMTIRHCLSGELPFGIRIAAGQMPRDNVALLSYCLANRYHVKNCDAAALAPALNRLDLLKKVRKTPMPMVWQPRSGR